MNNPLVVSIISLCVIGAIMAALAWAIRDYDEAQKEEAEEKKTKATRRAGER